MTSLATKICAGLLAFTALAAASSAVDITYTYDSLGRLTSANYACGNSIYYAYDPAGNRTVAGYASDCPPVAVSDTTTTAYNTAATFDPRTNDSDSNGYALAVTSVGTPGHGTSSFTGSSVTYTPASGFIGTDNFTYAISDGHGGAATAAITVAVQSSAPTADNDGVTTGYNTPVTLDPRVNDSDPNSFPIAVIAVGPAGHGSATRNTGSSVTYTPNTSYLGPDSFTYTIANDHGMTANATVSVTVTAGASAPVANNDSVSTGPDTAINFNPMSNDTGSGIAITSVGMPSHGTVSNSGTNLIYYPAAGYAGSDSFGYTITDSYARTASATIAMTVTVPNPIAPDANVEYTKPPIYTTVDPRTYNYSGETLAITAVGTPGNGTATIGGGGTYITYSAGGFTGATSFTYTVTDGFGHSATGTVYMQVDQGGGL